MLRKFARVAVATILVIVISTLLWFAAPTEDTAVAANNRGLVYNNKVEYHKAIVAFTAAIELDPNLALAYNNRGWAYLRLRQYEKAVADYGQAMSLDPSLQR